MLTTDKHCDDSTCSITVSAPMLNQGITWTTVSAPTLNRGIDDQSDKNNHNFGLGLGLLEECIRFMFLLSADLAIHARRFHGSYLLSSFGFDNRTYESIVVQQS